ncbi:MAG: hypothetical protein JRJ29_00805 [Deltaproteobacteria bacterium]|nr:hypothetical protein [Deltaproteobacteria bacterium]
MKLIDLEAHFFTRDYVEYLRQRRVPPHACLHVCISCPGRGKDPIRYGLSL